MPVLSTKPADLLAFKACLNCMSEKQLKAVMVYVMRNAAGVDLQTVSQGAACYRCLSQKQKLVALVAMMANQLMPTLSVNDLRVGTPCKRCAESSSDLDADILWLFANYFQNVAV